MKKTGILIAMFAMIATATAAMAEISVDFDGKLTPQSMHDIFANSHQLIPAGADAITPAPVPTSSNERPQALHNALAAYYIAQPKIKTLVAGYYLAKGNAGAVERLSEKSTRILAANSGVVIIRDGCQEWIIDTALAAKVESITFPDQQKALMEIAVTGWALLEAATNDTIWDAVGDAVSNISEAVNSGNYNDPNDTSEHNCASQGTC